MAHSDPPPTVTPPAGNVHRNRLANETSPYLLQHAGNPVDWNPWGAEAIERARREGKPLFVSIGYATCYWCHVMERESFEDPATAEVLNRITVPVKVDREQRPDIDDVYMTACQIYTAQTQGRASGGWPLSVFVEPTTLKPFYVGTYFPPTAAHGRPSFVELLEAIGEVWSTRREELTEQADRIAAAVVAELARDVDAVALDPDMPARAARALLTAHDRLNGGFGGAPKFPQPAYLELLTHVAWETPEVIACVARTLDRMAAGGIFDQIAGGFHRYSVDAIWSVPHFEKMLYDNAQLAALYARSAERTNDRHHAEVARRTCDYVLRSMTDADGSFFSAQDAEVEAKEGKSYVWRPDEVKAALEARSLAELVPTALAMYGLDGGTNFQDPHHASEPASNVLVLRGRPEQVAASLQLDLPSFQAKRAAIDAALLAARDARPQPITDDKILTAWNGLMIAGLAEVGMRLAEPRYVVAAARAAVAVDQRLRAADGTLLRTARGAVAAIPAFLEDYACFMHGLLTLARALGDDPAAKRCIARASELFDEAARWLSAPRGGFFDARADANELFVRGRSITDGPVPSGNGLMLINLLDLLQATGDDRFRAELSRSFAGLSGLIEEQPLGAIHATIAIWRARREAPDVLPVGAGEDDGLVVGAVTIASRDADATRLVVELRIQAGFHINANDPGEPSLVGLSIALRGAGTLAVEYPRGEPYGKGDRAPRVHSGTVAIHCTLRGVEPSSHLAVVVQPCDDTACRRPRTLLLELP